MENLIVKTGRVVHPVSEKDADLATLQRLVGGFIEPLPWSAWLPGDVVALVNEDGALMPSPTVTWLPDLRRPIYGPVVFVREVRTLSSATYAGLTDGQLQEIAERLVRFAQ